jgi:hypothetical protein
MALFEVPDRLVVGEKRRESLDFSVGERGGRYGAFLI